MIAITTVIILLLGGISQAMSPPNNGCPAHTHACVSFNQCINGVINTSGIGLIDLRIGPNSACQGICCRIPGATRPPTQIVTCGSNRICVTQNQCNSDGTINTDGSGIIDVRRIVNEQCYVDIANGVLGVCCTPPVKVIDTCPGNAQCVQPHLCTTKALNVNNAYVPYTQGGSWALCNLHDQSNNAGVCCERQTSQYPTAKQCGVRNSHLATRSGYKLAKNDAGFGEFPWQAAIFYTNFTFVCGASLIKNQWLVTAAHCVNGLRPHQLRIRLGEWQVNTENEPLPHIDVDIARIIVHNSFKPGSLHNDMALIKLKSPVPYQYHINSVCLPKQSQRQVSHGTRCFASGWGKDAFEGQFQYTLKSINVPVVEHSRCENLLTKTRLGSFFRLDSSFVCAGGEENKDVCRGDGGGPLVCQDTSNGRYFLYGITAWGINCGQRDVPGVYVNVHKFLGWMRKNMN